MRLRTYSFVLTLLFIFSFSNSFSQTSAIIRAYNKRFVDSAACMREQHVLLAKQQDANDKIISHAFLALSYLRFKNAEKAYLHIKENEALFSTSTHDEAASYYYYALFRYQFYMDEPFQDELAKAFHLFEKNKNYEFATYASSSLAYLPNTVDKKFMETALRYAGQSHDADVQIEALLCQASYYSDLYKEKPSDSLKQKTIESFNACVQIEMKKTLLQKANQAKLHLNYANFLVLSNGEKESIDILLQTAIDLSKQYKLLNIYRNTYGLKAELLVQQNKIREAEKTLKEGLAYIYTMPYVETESELLFYQSLKDIAAREKNYANYYHYDQDYQRCRRKMDIEQQTQYTNKAIAKYELQNVKESMALLEQKNRLKTILLIACVLIAGLLVVLFVQYTRAQKTKRQLADIQHEETLKEKSRIQKELLSSRLHLEKKNEILQSLKEKLTLQQKGKDTTVSHSVMQTIDQGIKLDDDFEKFKNNFNPAYPDFFDKLQARSQHSLTQLNLKYCAFILMKLTTKEIAQQMNVEPKSIRMARYRIKQKLSLPKEVELDAFITQLV